jgi:hypothetical protein
MALSGSVTISDKRTTIYRIVTLLSGWNSSTSASKWRILLSICEMSLTLCRALFGSLSECYWQVPKCQSSTLHPYSSRYRTLVFRTDALNTEQNPKAVVHVCIYVTQWANYRYESGQRNRYIDWPRIWRRREPISSPGKVKDFRFSMSSRPGLENWD